MRLVTQTLDERAEEILCPEGGRPRRRGRLVRECRRRSGPTLGLPGRDESRGLASHEFGERHARAVERARRARLDEFHDGADASVGVQRQRENGRVAPLPVDRGVAAVQEAGRGEVGDDQPTTRAEDFSDRRKWVSGAGHVLFDSPAGPAVCAQDTKASVVRAEGDPAGGHAHALGGDARESEQRCLQVNRVEWDGLQICSPGMDGGDRPAPVLDVEQGLHVGAPVATMAAGAAVAGDLAGIAPPPERVQAHAEFLRRLTEAEPVISVRSSYLHGGQGSGVGGPYAFGSSPILARILPESVARRRTVRNSRERQAVWPAHARWSLP